MELIRPGRISVLQNFLQSCVFQKCLGTEAAPWDGKESLGCVFSEALTHCPRFLIDKLETRIRLPHNTAQTGFKFVLVLSQPSESRFDRHEPPCLVYMVISIKNRPPCCLENIANFQIYLY